MFRNISPRETKLTSTEYRNGRLRKAGQTDLRQPPLGRHR